MSEFQCYATASRSTCCVRFINTTDEKKKGRSLSGIIIFFPVLIFPDNWECSRDYFFWSANNNGTTCLIIVSIRATKPKILIRVAIPLVSQAISAATSHHRFDKEVLMNGISYFTGPLLSWVLVGVIKHLVREVQQRQWVYFPFFPFIWRVCRRPFQNFTKRDRRRGKAVISLLLNLNWHRDTSYPSPSFWWHNLTPARTTLTLPCYPIDLLHQCTMRSFKLWSYHHHAPGRFWCYVVRRSGTLSRTVNDKPLHRLLHLLHLPLQRD